jgi:hypothetical protein
MHITVVGPLEAIRRSARKLVQAKGKKSGNWAERGVIVPGGLKETRFRERPFLKKRVKLEAAQRNIPSTPRQPQFAWAMTPARAKRNSSWHYLADAKRRPRFLLALAHAAGPPTGDCTPSLLEGVLQCKLNDTRIHRRRRDRSEGCRVHICSRIGKIWMVKCVEKLRTELQARIFSEAADRGPLG